MSRGKVAKCPGCGLERRLIRGTVEARAGDLIQRSVIVFCQECWRATITVIDDWSVFVQPGLGTDRAWRAASGRWSAAGVPAVAM